MTDKCFKKCVGKPGSTLDNSEQVFALNAYFNVYLRKYPNSSPSFRFLRNASPCAWIATWTRGTRSRALTIPDYREKEHAFDVQTVASISSVSLESSGRDAEPPRQVHGHSNLKTTAEGCRRNQVLGFKLYMDILNFIFKALNTMRMIYICHEIHMMVVMGRLILACYV